MTRNNQGVKCTRLLVPLECEMRCLSVLLPEKMHVTGQIRGVCLACVWFGKEEREGYNRNGLNNCRIFFNAIFTRNSKPYPKGRAPKKLLTLCVTSLLTLCDVSDLCFVTEQCPPRWARVESTSSAACSSTGGLYRTTSDIRSWRWRTTASGPASSLDSCGFPTAASPKSSADTRRRVRSDQEP